jgi:hypothetical protein
MSEISTEWPRQGEPGRYQFRGKRLFTDEPERLFLVRAFRNTPQSRLICWVEGFGELSPLEWEGVWLRIPEPALSAEEPE